MFLRGDQVIFVNVDTSLTFFKPNSVTVLVKGLVVLPIEYFIGVICMCPFNCVVAGFSSSAIMCVCTISYARYLTVCYGLLLHIIETVGE